MHVHTDMKEYVVVTDGFKQEYGVARLGPDETFDILKGTKVALMRFYLTPEVELPDFEEVKYNILIQYEPDFIMKTCLDIARWMGFCDAACCDVGMWRTVEEHCKKIDVELIMEG